MRRKFQEVRAYPGNAKWNRMVRREKPLYSRRGDVRSDFARDYNRILHSTAYRRLKHKTQVFFATGNDHICTRIEHVNHVVAVSRTICEALGLNSDLATAIALGHDLGHAPFGHEGESILRAIASRELKESFWHEGNSLWFVDRIETLAGPRGKERNLNLTYAVRDGIISHCGEVDQEPMTPRRNAIRLERIKQANEYPPFTWEGCVVKIADKISYLGRDIEDAYALDVLSQRQIEQLGKILEKKVSATEHYISNGVLIHTFTVDLCRNSTPRCGLGLSPGGAKLMEAIKDFNKEHIYLHPRLDYFKAYANLIIESIFRELMQLYETRRVLEELKKWDTLYPLSAEVFADWLVKYSDADPALKWKKGYRNSTVYRIARRRDYVRAVLHYIAGMTDSFAMRTFEELIRFQ